MIDPVVAVDVGNSAIKLSVRHRDLSDPQTQWIDHSIKIDDTDWDVSVIEWVADQLAPGPIQWRIASVHRSAADQLHLAIASRHGDDNIYRITRQCVPMRPQVDHPDRLGIDRLLGAYAANQRFGAPLVVIDAGSAVTVDWVNAEGDFRGGAILPGLALQFGSLATGTDALPRIDCSEVESLGVPAKNTSDAILLGVLTGVSASIDRLAHRYGVEAGLGPNDYRLILTGGDAEVISPCLTHSHQVVKNLVCRGLLDLPRSGLPQTIAAEELE